MNALRVDAFSEEAPKVVEEIVPSIVPLSTLHRVLRTLLEESVSIRDVGAILETLAEFAPKVEDPDLLTDLVRERLARTVTRPFLHADGSLHVITLDPTLEENLRAGVQRTPSGSLLAVDPPLLEQLLLGVQRALETTAPDAEGRGPVLLSGQAIRSPLRQLLSRAMPRVTVLSHNELPPDLRVVASSQVRVAPEARPAHAH